jgi:hypothetical protein
VPDASEAKVTTVQAIAAPNAAVDRQPLSPAARRSRWHSRAAKKMKHKRQDR